MPVEVGSAYVSIYPDTSSFEGELGKALKAVNITSDGNVVGTKAAKGFADGFSAASVAVGNLISEAVLGAVDMLGQSLDKGILRLDTIQNFPKVMQAFGYSAEDAAASVEQVSDHLVGLPGSTDEVLRLVQAISDSTGSLGLATTTGMAFNDMLTAAGADAASATLAMRTFDQIMGGGTITAQRWQALTSKMPLQMNMVAESLLGAGATSQMLGDALADGEVSLQDFAQAMSDLGPEFEVQARAMSAGVGTAITNVGNRIAKGWEEILKAIGQEEISGAINEFANTVMNGMKVAAGGVKWLKDRIIEAGIPGLFGRIGDMVADFFSNIDTQPLKDLAQGFIDLAKGGLQWIVDNGDTVAALLGVIGGAIAAIWAAGALSNIAGAIAALAANPILLVVAAVGMLVAAIVEWVSTTEEGQAAWQAFCDFVGPAASALGDAIVAVFETVAQFVGGVASIIQGAIDLLVGFATGDMERVKSGMEVGAQGIEGVFGSLGDVVTGFVDAVWKNAASAMGMSVEDAKDTVKKALDSISRSWDNTKKKIADTVSSIKQKIVDGFKNAVKKAADAIAGFKTTASNIWNGIKNTVSGIVTNLKNSVVSTWNGLKSSVTDVVNGIKSIVEKIFNGIATSVGNATNTAKTAAVTAWNAIKTAIKTIIDGIKTAIENVFGGIAKSVKDIFDGIAKTASSIWGSIKSAITGNAGDAAKGVSNSTASMQKSINGVNGKNVTLKVTESGAKKAAQAVKDSINSVPNTTKKYIELYAYKSGIDGVDVATNTVNGFTRIRVNPVRERMADGGIVSAAMFALVGEAGSEAVIPLSNRQKVRPFAQAVAAEMGGGGGVTVTGNTFYVRNDDDIRKVAVELNTLISRQRTGALA